MRKSVYGKEGGVSAVADAPGGTGEMTCVPEAVEVRETAIFVCADVPARSAFDEPDGDYWLDDEAYAKRPGGDPSDEDMLYEPGAKVPHSGIYVMVNPTGEVTDTERTAVKGEPFPPTAAPGQRYRLARPAHNAAGVL